MKKKKWRKEKLFLGGDAELLARPRHILAPL